MHQIQLWLGLRPTPRWGNLRRSPDLLAEFKGPTSTGGEGKGWEMGRSGEREDGKGKGRMLRGQGEDTPDSCLHPLI